MKIPTNHTEISRIFNAMCSHQLGFSTVSVCFAATSGKKRLPEFRKVHLGDRAADNFRQIVDQTQRILLKNLHQAAVAFRLYAPETKLDSHEVEYMHLSEAAEIADQIASLSALAEMPSFDLTDRHFVQSLRFYVIVVRFADPDVAPIYLFRTYTHSKILGQSRSFGLVWRPGYFDKIEEQVIVFDNQVDCISWGEHLFILKKDYFQRIFQYFERLQVAAQAMLEEIRQQVPIANFDQMAKDVSNHILKLAKLRSILRKPYLAKLTMTDLKTMIARRKLSISMQLVENQECLVYDPTDPWPLLRLLDDDNLTSPMTGMDYEAMSKRDVATI